MLKTNSARPSAKDLRIFALILTVGFLFIGGLVPYFKNKSFNMLLVIVGGSFFLVGMLCPKLLIYPRKYWIIIGNIMGKINSTILFTLMYILIFSTVGLIFKIFKRDRLKTGFRKVSTTMVLKNEISTFEDPF